MSHSDASETRGLNRCELLRVEGGERPSSKGLENGTSVTVSLQIHGLYSNEITLFERTIAAIDLK